MSLRHAAIYGALAAVAFLLAGECFHLIPDASLLQQLLTAGLIPLQLAVLLVSAAFTGAGLLRVVNWVLVCSWAISLLLLGGLAAWHVSNVDWALSAYLAGPIVQLSLLLAHPHLRRDRQVSAAEQAPPTMVVLKYAIRAYPGTLAGFLQLSVAGLLLGLVAPPREVGLYSVAYAVAAALFMLPIIVGTVLLPGVARAEKLKASQSAALATRVSLFLTLCLGVTAFSAAAVFIPFVFGAAFRPAIAVLMVLSPAVLAYSVSKILAAYFQGMNRPEIPSLTALFGLLVAVAVEWPLASRFGAQGAAFALSVAMACVASIQLWLFVRISQMPVRAVVWPRLADLRMIAQELAGIVPTAFVPPGWGK